MGSGRWIKLRDIPLDHDPRKDPYTGDVLRKGRVTRQVMMQRFLGTARFWKTGGSPEDASEEEILLSSWRRWAKNAKVIHVRRS